MKQLLRTGIEERRRGPTQKIKVRKMANNV
jgi:hypothetical protein